MLKEVLDLLLEAIISLVVIIGGGFLILKGVASELASSAIGAVIAYWFSNRQARINLPQNQPQQYTQPAQIQPQTNLVSPPIPPQQNNMGQ